MGRKTTQLYFVMDNLRDVSEACSQLIKCGCKQTCTMRCKFKVSEMIRIALTYAHVKEDVHCNILNVKICGLVVLGSF